MDRFAEGLRDALRLVVTGDDQVRDITVRTLHVALEATLIAAVIGIPLGAVLGLYRFPGRGLALGVVNIGLRFPPVGLGMILWLLLWPDSRWGGGPLSGLGWIYTLNAVILAQTLLALPVVTALTAAAVQSVPPELIQQARAFGASPLRRAALALREARVGIAAGVVAALGIAIATVGAVVIVGSSLGTAMLATAALTQWNAGGQDAGAVAYGIVLLGVFLVIATALTTLQYRRDT